MTKTRETKVLQHVPLEIKEVSRAERTFRALASTFDVDHGRDRFTPGAWKRTIDHFSASSRRKIWLKDSHRRDSVFVILGHLIALEETDEGLWITAKVTQRKEGDDLLTMIEEGNAPELSVGFYTMKHRYATVEIGSEKIQVREIQEAQLDEVSVVERGMNPYTEIDPRSLKSMLKSLDDLTLETFLDALSELDLKEALRPAENVLLNDDQTSLLTTLRDGCSALLTASEEQKGLAPEDPVRLALESQYLDLIRRTLATPA